MEFKRENIPFFSVCVLLIVAAFFIGNYRAELKYLRGGGALPQATGTPTAPTAPPEDNSATLAKEVERPSQDDHIRGNPNANIAIIEYSDYECPYCKQFHPSMQQVMSEYNDEVMWVYRHFPLEQIHPMARPAAIASECVADLAGSDAFWTFTDTVFENQALISVDQIDSWALATGIDSTAYETCKLDSSVANIVDADLQSGISAGVNGTPGTIIMNINSGEVSVLPGAVPFAQIQSAIESLR